MSNVEKAITDLETSKGEVFAALMQEWRHTPKPTGE